MKNKVLQIARDNDSALMEGKFSYRAEKILHKPILFDTSRVDEESIMDKIIENLLSTNDEFYMIMNWEQTHGTNSFSLRHEDGK